MDSTNGPTTMNGGYSAEVDLSLRVNGCRFAASHVARDHVILVAPAAVPGGLAEVVVVVDGVTSRRAVVLDACGEERHVVPIRAGDSE